MGPITQYNPNLDLAKKPAKGDEIHFTRIFLCSLSLRNVKNLNHVKSFTDKKIDCDFKNALIQLCLIDVLKGVHIR